jgi:hypothetical protein
MRALTPIRSRVNIGKDETANNRSFILASSSQLALVLLFNKDTGKK